MKDETWIVPMAWFQLGETAFEQKNVQEMRRCHESCKKFKKYDWERVLEFKMFIREQKLKIRPIA